MEIQLLPEQADFVTDTKTRYLGFVGGYRSGKTYSLAYKIITLAALNHGYKGVAMSPTYGMLKRVLIPEIEGCLSQMHIKYEYAKADSYFRLHWKRGTSTEVQLHAAENHERLRGSTFAFGCVDEMDTIKRDDAHAAWRQLMARMSEANAPALQACAVSTPEGFSFMHDFFVRDAVNPDGSMKTDRRLIRASTRNNPFLSDDYIPSILGNFASNQIPAYIDGEFANLTTGNVYYAFNRDLNLNGTTKTLEDFPNSVLQIGVDFNIGNMSGSVWISENGKVYAVDELSGAFNTEAFVDDVIRRYDGRRIMFYPDAQGFHHGGTNASYTDFEILRRVPNSTIHAYTAHMRIKDRVGSVNAMILNGKKERRLFVNVGKCPKLTAGLEQQGYDDGEPDKSSNLDHMLDAAGYFISFRYAIRGHGTIRQVY